ncbi:unnamed protein product [Rotaria sp. Silwood1]|nr:unnamed protein product [Rotaria sp. Silwood1]
MTSQRIHELILRQPHIHYSSIIVDESNIFMGGVHPSTEDSPYNYVFAANRDEQSNDRITHPSDTFSNMSINPPNCAAIHLDFDLGWHNIPVGIQDTQPHSMVMPIRINTFHEDIIINDENGAVNEDATNLNEIVTTEDVNLTINHEYNNQTIVRESTGIAATDELMDDVNSTTSADAADNNYSNINNDDEQMMEYDNTVQTEQEENFYSDTDEEGQVLPRSENTNHHTIQDNIQSNIPTAIILTSSGATTTLMNGIDNFFLFLFSDKIFAFCFLFHKDSSEQAEDVESILGGPTDNNHHTFENPDRLLSIDADVSQLNARTHKHSNRLDSTTNPGEEQRAL